MTDKELVERLAKMGYTNLWLDYGVLTIEYFIAQEETFDNSDDQNTEHYRYHTFRHYLRSKINLSDAEFTNYLQLTFNDTDPVMAGSATVDLFQKVSLTDSQFEKLCKTIGHFGEWTEKVVTRHTLLRRLRTSRLTNEVFKECIVNGDSVVHEYIIDIAEKNQLEELAVKGKNKAIRNIASEKLRKLTGAPSR